MDPVVSDSLRLVLALLFANSLAHKLRDLAGFRHALAGYALLPDALVFSAVLALVAAEGALVLLLVLPVTAQSGSLAAAALLSVYTSAIAINLARGRREIDCGCGGPAGPQPIGTRLLWRNAFLLGLCGLAALDASPRALFWLDRVTTCFTVTTLALAYYAAGLLAGHSDPLQRRMSS